MKKILYFVRNTQSVDEAQQWFTGHTDHPLTEQGEKEAHQLAFRFHVTPVDYLFVSPLQRAVQTAEILTRYLPVEVTCEDALREWNREGILSGMTRSQAERIYPEELRKLEYYRTHALQGEFYTDFVARVHAAFTEILAAPYKRIMIVAHARVIGVWLKEIHMTYEDAQEIKHPAHALEIHFNPRKRIHKLHSFAFPEKSTAQIFA